LGFFDFLSCYWINVFTFTKNFQQQNYASPFVVVEHKRQQIKDIVNKEIELELGTIKF